MTDTPCSHNSLYCTRCETLPEEVKPPFSLFMWFPNPHSMGKAVSTLHASGMAYERIENGGCLRWDGDETYLDGLEALNNELSELERDDTRVLCMPPGNEPGVNDFPNVESFHEFYDSCHSSWYFKLLKDERLTSFFHPIVFTSKPDSVFANECLLRGIDEEGGLIPPGRIFDAARGSSTLFQLDLAARRSALIQASKHSLDTYLFINFNPASIYDPRNCLKTTTGLIEELGLMRSKIVFEVVESENIERPDHLMEILNFYRQSGFMVALDDVGSGYSSLNMIHKIQPDFIKLDRELIIDIHLNETKAVIASKILEIAEELNIRTIVEGVECKEEYEWVLEHKADYVQGFYFAKPAPEPNQLNQLPAAN